jgi:hypothetical protein
MPRCHRVWFPNVAGGLGEPGVPRARGCLIGEAQTVHEESGYLLSAPD